MRGVDKEEVEVGGYLLVPVRASERRRRLAGCRSLRTRRTERTTSRLPRMEQRIIRQMATTIPVGINILRLPSVLPLLISENSCR